MELALAALRAAPRASPAERLALRSLWRHLAATPVVEPPCTDCDCGTPCETQPVRDWALSTDDDHGRSAALLAYREAQRAHDACVAAPSATEPSEPGSALPFETVAAALLRASRLTAITHGDTKQPFVHLGAGCGSSVLAAALLGGFSVARGWEREPGRAAAAAAALARAAQLPTPPAAASVALGDAVGADWAGAGVVLCSAPEDTRLAAETVAAAPSLRPGSVLITAGARASTPALQLFERRRMLCSWGMGTVYMHVRIHDARAAAGCPHAGGLLGLAGQDDSAELYQLRQDGGLARVAEAVQAGCLEGATTAAFAARAELCARALASAGVPTALASLLRPPTGEADVRRRAAAAFAVTSLAAHPASAHALVDQGCLPPLVALLSDGDVPPALRAAAASALADIADASDSCADAVGGTGVATRLGELVNDSHAGTVTAARAALTALGKAEPAFLD